MRNILLKIEYDGTEFSGWQRQPQPEVRTVQGEIEETLSRLCGQEIRIDGTGRTDAGVHALGQCATFSGDFGIPVPDYTEENVSTKVVKIIQSYTGVVNKMVWRKY